MGKLSAGTLLLCTSALIFLASFSVLEESRASSFDSRFQDVTGPKLYKEFRVLGTSESGIPLHRSELTSDRALLGALRRRHRRRPRLRSPPAPMANPPISPADINSFLESIV